MFLRSCHLGYFMFNLSNTPPLDSMGLWIRIDRRRGHAFFLSGLIIQSVASLCGINSLSCHLCLYKPRLCNRWNLRTKGSAQSLNFSIRWSHTLLSSYEKPCKISNDEQYHKWRHQVFGVELNADQVRKLHPSQPSSSFTTLFGIALRIPNSVFFGFGFKNWIFPLWHDFADFD